MRLKAVFVFLTLLCLISIGVTAGFAKSKSTIRYPAEHIGLNVTFDLENNSVEGIANLKVPFKGPNFAGFLLNRKFKVKWVKFAGEKVELERDNAFDPEDISPEYGIQGKWEESKPSLWSLKIPKTALKAAKKANKEFIISVKFSGKLFAAPEDRQFSREKIAAEVNGTIGPDGIYLSPSSFWYPQLPDAPCPIEVTATVPKGWMFVTTGVASSPLDVEGGTKMTYTSKRPIDGIYLSAGPYIKESEKFHNIELVTYFLPAQKDLAKGYMEACRGYVSKYEKLLGPYPFESFAVVDNFLPSGYGMPGWTLLGSEVIRLPFIKDISLGHEYVHNWFGNSLYVDYRGGNWCEGLTMYLSDYQYKKDIDSSSAANYRRGVLMDYASYVTELNDYPVSEFVGRSNSADRAIGYGKTMMIFHMLHWMCDIEDPNKFDTIIKETYNENQWNPISWTVWRQSFEKNMSNKLDWFNKQWIEQAGAPQLSLTNVEVVDDPEYFYWTAIIDIKSVSPKGQKPYRYWLPVIAKMKDGGKVETATFIDSDQAQVRIDGPGELASVHLDPSFEVFRHLYTDEMPLTLSKIMGDKDAVLVIPSLGDRVEQWRQVAEGLKSDGQEVITADKWESRHNNKTAWLFGSPVENQAWTKLLTQSDNFRYRAKIRELFGDKGIEGLEMDTTQYLGTKLTATMITEHPTEAKEALVFTLALPDADPIAGTRKLSHYGKYSVLVFDGDKNIHKQVNASSGANPMVWVAPKK